MGRPKGSKNTTENAPDSMALDPVVNTGKEAVTDKMFNLAEVQAMVDKAVTKAMLDKSGITALDDTGYWMAKVKCQSEIFGCLEPEQIIRLSDENERSLKLGKYAEMKQDKNGTVVKVTYGNMVKPSQYTLQRIMQTGEERAAEEGLYILPAPNASQSLDDKKPFKLVSAK